MKSITLLPCGLIGALNLAGCSRKSPQAGPAAPEVLVIEAATRDLPVYREWIGTIDGSENADIRARVTGHLIKRNYNEGSLVKKGDVLFEIDPRPFEAALSQAKSELEEGKAASARCGTPKFAFEHPAPPCGSVTKIVSKISKNTTHATLAHFEPVFRLFWD
jgi:multidrug efflux pump subunit AcrA (membrane-fusion protein)